jgi:TetR/AcrR family fatty acid metabolism transcriptional regulator
MNGHSSRRSTRSAKEKAPASPARDPSRTEQKRERILDAAVRVFAQEGFYNAKVSQIAHAAGVADGTIYLYFKSKDDLLISLFEDRMEQVNTNLQKALTGATSAVDRLKSVVRLHLKLIEENRHMAEVICVELRQSSKFIKEYSNPKFAEFLRLIAGAIAEGQASGELRRDLDPQIISRALFGALDEIALAWLVKGRERFDLDRAADQLGRVFVEGLRAR